MSTPIDDLLKQVREHYESAQDAINTLVRMQVAQGLAPLFFDEFRPYERHEQLAAWMEQGLLNQVTFLQKPPELLHFYKRLLVGLEPARMLEIGVKGGGSTAFWKQLFPSAVVVGMDLKIRRGLAGDGVIYVQGDQSDAARLAAIADEYGPFDLVIDDGSHVSDHQATSLRALLNHVRGGGVYVIEDIHTSLKPRVGRDYGEDIWPDFVMTLFQGLRKAPPSTASVGVQLALEVLPRTDDVILNERAIALRVR